MQGEDKRFQTCHSEKADQTFNIWAENHRPTKNLTFKQQGLVFADSSQT
jgi:hypothetical protein